jgi:lysophospholipase L1-like esterase
MASKAVRRRALALTAAALVLIAGLVAAVWPGGPGGEAKPSPSDPPHEQIAAVRKIGAARPGIATTCRVTPVSSPGGGTRPLVVVLGASFTAGQGAPAPADGWAVQLARLIGWRAVTVGVPGVGYTRLGVDHLGPLSRILDRLHLAQLHPALVIIQAGHNDRRVPAALEAKHVADLIRRLRSEVPAARLAFLTVFSPSAASTTTRAAEAATDSAIVSVIRKTDPGAIVIDPLRSGWQFPRADGLHPTARGDLLIAQRVARSLTQAGVAATPAPQPSPARVTCTVLGDAPDHLGRGQPAAGRAPRPGRPAVGQQSTG